MMNGEVGMMDGHTDTQTYGFTIAKVSK